MPSGSSIEGEPFQARAGEVLVAVRLTPRGGRDALEGVEALADGRRVIKARVRAAPEHGAANEALLRLLARAAGVAPSAARLAAGHSARLKTVSLSGEPDAILAALRPATGGTKQG